MKVFSLEEIRKPGNELTLLQLVRKLCWISSCEDRTPEQFLDSLDTIFILTKAVGNETPFDLDWEEIRAIKKKSQPTPSIDAK